LRISYSRKRPDNQKSIKQKTTKNRTPVGDKGLGRLATMKLGEIIRLDTSVEGEKKKRGVWFTWKDFKSERSLSDVPVHEIEKSEQTLADDKGSTITVVGLKDRKRWMSNKAISSDLKSSFSTLVSPFLAKKHGFTISIFHNDSKYGLAHLTQDVLNLCTSSYKWDWDGTSIKHNVEIDEKFFFGTGTGASDSNFRKVFLNKKNKNNFLNRLLTCKKLERFNARRMENDGFISLEFDDHIGGDFPKNSEFEVLENPGIFHINLYDFNLASDIQKSIAAAGGNVEQIKSSHVQIFRDNFLIRGSKDWLDLASGQTEGSSYYGLRPLNVIGYCNISNEFNPGLVEKSDREGFVDNEEYRGFIFLAKKSRNITNQFREILRREYNEFLKSLDGNSSDTKSAAKTMESTKKHAKKLKEELSTAVVVVEEILKNGENVEGSELKKLLGKLKDAHNQSDEKANSLNLLSRHVDDTDEMNLRLMEAASVGLTARSISHELHQYSRQLKEVYSNIKKENLKIKNRVIASILVLLNSTVKELNKMISALDPMLPGSRSIKEKIEIRPFVEKYLSGRKPFLDKKKVSFEVIDKSESALTIRFSISRLLQVLENLLQNSVYWLSAIEKKSTSKKQIILTITEEGLYWEDSGPGVNPLLDNTLFDAYVSDKSDGQGQGLGLHISSVFLGAEKCTINLCDDKNKFGRKHKFFINLSKARFAKRQGGLF
ncbi:MAG: hypothetical protein OQJ89_16490, partial [Kangiellaceae bacterium]|nr:hypothetical protein [Kangiellaceae bacterium]